jgi:hypothetical protein
MKRDMDLIRQILLATEANPSPVEPLEDLHFDGFDDNVVAHHVELLAMAGLVTAEEAQAIGIYEWHPVALTWVGHDFLDTIRDPEM